MKVFLVEDDRSVREIFVDFCSKRGIELVATSNLSDAMRVVARDDYDFDFAVCDLKLPSTDGSVDEAVEHGLLVLRELISKWPGVPVIVSSAFGTVDVVSDMLWSARQIDVYGTGDLVPMLRFAQKARPLRVIEALNATADNLRAIDEIELYAPMLLEPYRRALRVFGRRKSGATVEYRALAGGRSGAQTGLASVKDAAGALKAYVVAKLTTLDRVAGERQRYQRFVSGRLAAATFADLSDEVVAGCGAYGGLFYSVATSFDRDLFAVLRESDEDAEAVVAALRQNCAPWLSGVPQARQTWLDIRRNLLSDDAYVAVAGRYAVRPTPDDRTVQTLWAPQHGDLHGANVLVDDSLRPVVIDYGRTGDAPSVLDPLTLELSSSFHPESPLSSGSWPTCDDIEVWDDLDKYLRNCPRPRFVRACREWARAVRVGRRDMFATVNAYCLRNLQYDDVKSDVLLCLQRLAAQEVNAA